MSWLDKFISGFLVLVNGTEQVQPGAVNFSGVGVTSEKVGNQLNITVASGGDLAGSTSILISGGIASCITGATTGKVCAADDARLSNTRAPTSHGSTHAPGSADAIATGTTSTSVCIGDDARLSNPRTPTAHAASHQTGGTDAIVIDGPAWEVQNAPVGSPVTTVNIVGLGNVSANGTLADGVLTIEISYSSQ